MVKNSLVLVYSGGLDSTVLLHSLLKENQYAIRAISFSYGQKHQKELERARENCCKLHIPHEVVNLPLDSIFTSTLLESGAAIPEGHYEEVSMKQTVVPMRNLIFASIAAGYASSHGISALALAVHSGDHAIYPDCRPEFFESLQNTIHLSDWNEVDIKTPFLHFTKKQIVELGLKLGVDFAQTWTCYKGLEKPCGVCGSCTERAEAFALNHAEDPLEN